MASMLGPENVRIPLKVRECEKCDCASASAPLGWPSAHSEDTFLLLSIFTEDYGLNTSICMSAFYEGAFKE